MLERYKRIFYRHLRDYFKTSTIKLHRDINCLIPVPCSFRKVCRDTSRDTDAKSSLYANIVAKRLLQACLAAQKT